MNLLLMVGNTKICGASDSEVPSYRLLATRLKLITMKNLLKKTIIYLFGLRVKSQTKVIWKRNPRY